MNIIITGASKGIGKELVIEFSKNEENKIFALSRDLKKLEEIKNSCILKNNFSNIEIFSIDLNKYPEVEELIQKISNKFGSIDLLINNAAVLGRQSFSKIKMADFKSIFDTNFFSIVHLIQTTLPFFNKKLSHIVNIGSMGGFQGSKKFPGLSAYSSSKSALSNLTECLAEEFAELNIKVNCLALGSVETEMFQEAFPNLEAQNTAKDMAKFIFDFCIYGPEFFNGKIIPVSKSTP